MTRGRSRPLAINLALQGGGAHGSFTWGVLDRLLEEPGLELHWTSGTSAGAVNAAVMASGITGGGYAAARTMLRHVWERVMSAASSALDLRTNPLLATFFNFAQLANVAALMSPYDFNPLGFDPLRRILEEAIDFAAIRRHPGPDLLIAATDVETGRAQTFRRKELRVEHVLASACLPSLHHAVEIGGRLYWDGGFSANPDLITLALESPCRDTLLVELNPRVDPLRPRTAAEISARVANITFSQPLVRDLQLIAAAKSHAVGLFSGPRHSDVARLQRHNFHIIEAGRHTGQLGMDSRIQPDRQMMMKLFAAGRADCAVWLERHGGDVGRRSTLELSAFTAMPGAAGADLRERGSGAPLRRPPAGRSPR